MSNMEPVTISLLIFTLTFLLIITELVHKTLAALIGSFLMVIYNFVTYSEIGKLVNFEVIGVIFGMMILVEVIKESGLFQFLGIKMIKITRGKPRRLFVFLTLFTGIISGLLGGATGILIASALTFTVCRSLELDPIPFIISEAIVTNIGATMLLTSSSTNIIIADAAKLSFMDFIPVTIPISIILLAVTTVILLYINKDSFRNGKSTITDEMDPWSVVKDKPFFWKSTLILFFTIVFFIFHEKVGVTVDFVAISSAIIILLVSDANLDEVFKELHWGTLIFFSCLFIVVGGLEITGVLDIFSRSLIRLTEGNQKFLIPLSIWIPGLISGFTNDVTLTVTLVPVLRDLAGSFGNNIIWWVGMTAISLGGNFTPIGSRAGAIVSSIAKKEGYSIPLRETLRTGIALALTHLLLVTGYFLVLSFLF
ncbi:MAG: hypothetical protein GF368_02445 [Candidatus Aenigmarchaeota archaeon]|nr:hypothetical protein [Candidatus Aenigmarchaeota archaeon]